MVQSVANSCADILTQHKIIQKDKRAIYVYGFELFFSTVFSIMFMLFLGVIFGYWKWVGIFLLYFMPIRIVAGGYHAKSYGHCFLLSNSIAILCIWAARKLWMWNVLWLDILLWLAFLISFAYIWISAPVVSKRYPQKPERIIKNRGYAHILLCIEGMVLIVGNMLLYDRMVYTAIITSCAVAIMIFAAEKGGA